jgi:hypothetical protein
MPRIPRRSSSAFDDRVLRFEEFERRNLLHFGRG